MTDHHDGLVCYEDPYWHGSPLCGFTYTQRVLQPFGLVTCMRCIAYSNNVRLYKEQYGVQGSRYFNVKTLRRVV